MIQFIRPSVGSYIHQPCFSSGSAPAILFQGLTSEVKHVGFRPLQTGPKDQYGNKPCYHLNLQGKVALLNPNDYTVEKSQYDYADRACTIPFFITCFRSKQKSWAFSHLTKRGDNISFKYDTYYKYRYSYWSYQTIRRFTTTNISWLDIYRMRYECWYDEYNFDTNVYSGYVYIYYFEFDKTTQKSRYRFSTIRYSGQSHPPVASWLTPTTSWASYSSAVHTVTNLSSMVIPSRGDFLHRLVIFRRDAMAKESFFFGQCTVRSAQALRVIKVNIFSYLIEASWLFGPLTSLKTLVEEFLSSSTAKKVSKMTLGYQYGIRLTILDTLQLLRQPRSSVGFDPMSWTSSRSQMSDQTSSHIFVTPVTIDTKYYQKLYCQRHSSVFIDAWARLMSVGAYPFLETAWDLIPFSFVVDWFTQVNEVLEAIDSNTILNSYAIQSCITTRRSSTTLPFSDIFPELQGYALGDLTIVDYHRTVDKVPPPIRLDLTPQSFTHWVEGSALIVQRL